MLRDYKERKKRLTVYFCILTFCLILLLNVEIAISYTNITPAEVKTALETEDVFLLDVRTESEYLAGHIPGAYLIPHTELEAVCACKLPANLSQPIIVYCASGTRSAIAADILDSMEYTDVRNMEGGFSAWPYEVEYGSGTTTTIIIAISYTNITPAEVKTALETEDVFLLDVRTESEYLAGHIPGAYLIPYTELEDRRNELPANLSQPIIVYCASGTRSAIAADILDSMEYTDVRNMKGGFSAWSYEIEYGSGITTVTEISRAFNVSYWIPFIIIFSFLPIIRRWKENKCF